MRTVHIYSAMLVLLLMVFFSVTGFFLNHPDYGSTSPGDEISDVVAPDWLMRLDNWPEDYTSHGLAMLVWLDKEQDVRGVHFNFEWDEFDEVLLVTLDSPSVSTAVEFYTQEGQITIERRSLSLLATLNNIHRAKYTSGFWLLVSDVSAIAMLLFCLTGLWLMLANRLERFKGLVWGMAGALVFYLAVQLMH